MAGVLKITKKLRQSETGWRGKKRSGDKLQQIWYGMIGDACSVMEVAWM